MTERLLPPTFLFRFSVPCRYHNASGSTGAVVLGSEFSIPSFGELEERDSFADIRVAWSEDGLAITCDVTGKSQSLWCRSSKLDDSDGLQVWIDTRDAHNIHRASRFCHRFYFLPQGGGTRSTQPIGEWTAIRRAKENPKPVAGKQLKVKSTVQPNGYHLAAIIPADCLTGFDPVDHPRLGFYFVVIDRELGFQSFCVGSEFPFADDPSLWGTLELKPRN